MEEQVKKQVGDWLEKSGCEIYDENTRLGWPRFTFKGSPRPDLLVKSEKSDNIWVAIEVKSGDSNDEIISGFYQVLRQFYAYISGQAIFSVESKEIAVDAFALATNYSPEGFLYERERSYDTLIHNISKYRRELKKLNTKLKKLGTSPKVISDLKRDVIDPLRMPWPEAPWPYVIARAMWKLADQFREHVQSMPLLPGFSPRPDADKVVVGTLQQHFRQNRPYVLGGPKRRGHLYL